MGPASPSAETREACRSSCEESDTRGSVQVEDFVPLRFLLLQSKIREPQVANCIKRVQSHSFQSQDYISKYSLNSVLHAYILKLIFFITESHAVFHMEPCPTSTKMRLRKSPGT